MNKDISNRIARVYVNAHGQIHIHTYIHFFILTTRTSRVQDIQIELQQIKTKSNNLKTANYITKTIIVVHVILNDSPSS